MFPFDKCFVSNLVASFYPHIEYVTVVMVYFDVVDTVVIFIRLLAKLFCFVNL